jgi:predicted HTH domain antitoxin
MSITLKIPDNVIQGLRLPETEAEQRMKVELAVALYAQGLLALGKAAELAETPRLRFAELLAERGVDRHYSSEDLADDLAYASGE